MESGYATPVAAARGDIPERFARALGVALSPDGRRAVVLLGTNEQSDPYPYQVICERAGERWVEGISGNGPGWSSTGEDELDAGVGVLTAWAVAPAGSSAAVLEFAGREHEVAVSGGYYLFAAWDVPAGESGAAPVVRRFV